MRESLLNFGRQTSLASFLLAMLLFRAYVPVGFMPASGTPFLLEICPVGLPVQMPAHHVHHRSGVHGHFDNCPFGSASAAGPASHLGAIGPTLRIDLEPVAAIELLPVGVQLVYLPQPRGPPLLA
jgi:hypothetical protein